MGVGSLSPEDTHSLRCNYGAILHACSRDSARLLCTYTPLSSDTQQPGIGGGKGGVGGWFKWVRMRKEAMVLQRAGGCGVSVEKIDVQGADKNRVE